MDKIPATPPDDARKTRSDGAQSRERLLLTAMRLFAEQGFAKTSTREIALGAGTNIASISYYFGDKAGLYRAAYTEPACHPDPDPALFNHPGATLRDSMTAFFTMLLGPLKMGDMARLAMRMWFREMLEPTGLWHEEINNGIKPAHEGMAQVLAHHLGLDAPNDDISRLAFSIVGVAIQPMVGREIIDKIAPQLLDNEAAVDLWMARMVDYALAMVEVERGHIARSPQSPDSLSTPSQPRKKKA